MHLTLQVDFVGSFCGPCASFAWDARGGDGGGAGGLCRNVPPHSFSTPSSCIFKAGIAAFIFCLRRLCEVGDVYTSRIVYIFVITPTDVNINWLLQ